MSVKRFLCYKTPGILKELLFATAFIMLCMFLVSGPALLPNLLKRSVDEQTQLNLNQDAGAKTHLQNKRPENAAVKGELKSQAKHNDQKPPENSPKPNKDTNENAEKRKIRKMIRSQMKMRRKLLKIRQNLPLMAKVTWR